jgi:hypothetical protein
LPALIAGGHFAFAAVIVVAGDLDTVVLANLKLPLRPPVPLFLRWSSSVAHDTVAPPPALSLWQLPPPAEMNQPNFIAAAVPQTRVSASTSLLQLRSGEWAGRLAAAGVAAAARRMRKRFAKLAGRAEREHLLQTERGTHHTLHLVWGFMGEPRGQPNACAKCGWLLKVPRTRSHASEWGSVKSWWFAASSVIFSHHTCENATKKSWSSVKGTCTPVPAMVNTERWLLYVSKELWVPPESAKFSPRVFIPFSPSDL